MVVFAWWGLIYVAGGQCKWKRSDKIRSVEFDHIFLWNQSHVHRHFEFIHSCYHVRLLRSQCVWTFDPEVSLVETLFDSSANRSFETRKSQGKLTFSRVWFQIQFLAVITHSVVNFTTKCYFPKIFDAAFLIYCITILVLFLNFYIQAYIKGRRMPKKAKENWVWKKLDKPEEEQFRCFY